MGARMSHKSNMEEMRSKGMELTDSTDQLLLGLSANGPQHHHHHRPVYDSAVDASSMELMTINVGGARFVTTRLTLDRIQNTRLSNLQRSDRNYNHITQEWFFDRNPALFNFILDYYRSDELHLPHNFCGPSVKKELIYWKIDECDISPCCWNRYREFEEEKRIFDNIDQAFESRDVVKTMYTHSEIVTPSTWQKWRRRIFLFLEEPMSSRAAQIWTVIFLLFVLASIGILCIETVPQLRVPFPSERTKVKEHDSVHVQPAEPPPTGGPYTNTSDVPYKLVDVTLNNFSWVPRTVSPDLEFQGNLKIELLMTTEPHPALEHIDSFCTCFFTIEFVIRFIVAPDRIKFWKSVMNIIDVLCVLPMWIKYIMLIYEVRMSMDLLPLFFMIMMLRVLRICRVLRLARHYTGVKILLLALKASCKELGMLVIFVFIVVLIFSVVIYYAEFFVKDTFHTIPEGYWWAIITLTTVGYGDMYPKSPLGYVVGAMCALTGILATGLPVPIIANNFNIYYTHAQLKDAVRNRKPGRRMSIASQSDANDEKQPLTDGEKKQDPLIVKEATV